MRWVKNVSLFLNRVSFRDTHESLCSRAWRMRGRSAVARAWVKVFGRGHCFRSYVYYWGMPEGSTKSALDV